MLVSGKQVSAAAARRSELLADRVEHGVHLRLIGARIGFRDAAEMTRALRHRYLMVYYAGLAVAASALIYGLTLIQAPTDLIVSTLVIGLVTLHLVVVAYLRAAAALLRWLGWRVSIWVTPALVVGTVAMTWMVQLTQSVMDVPTDWLQGWKIGVWIVCFLVVEGLAMVIFHGPLPRALAVMRAGEDDLAAAAEADLPTLSRDLVMEGSGEAMPEPLVAGTVRIPLPQVQRLEANGNYVLVVTGRGRHLLPGPFGAVASVMPERLGRRVHRSHWVSTGAAVRLVKSGRDLWIEATGGAVVPVAASMQDQVEHWLAGHGIFLERGPRPRAERAAR